MTTSQQAPVAESSARSIPLQLPRSGVRGLLFLLVILLVVAGVALLAFRPDVSEALPQLQPERMPPPLPEPLQQQGPALSARVENLDERTHGLVRRVDAVTKALADIEASLVTFSESADQLRLRLDALEQPPRRPVVRRTQPPKPAAPAKPKQPTIVAVDTWGSQPSVAIRNLDGDLAFYREGDRVGLARIQRIDTRSQQVQLRLPDGDIVMIGVRD